MFFQTWQCQHVMLKHDMWHCHVLSLHFVLALSQWESNLGPPQVCCLHWTQNILTQTYDYQIPFCSGSITRAKLSAVSAIAQSNLGPPQAWCLHWTQNILIQAYDNQITLRSFTIRFSSLESHSSSNDWPVAKVQWNFHSCRAHEAFGVNKFTLALWALMRASEREP